MDLSATIVIMTGVLLFFGFIIWMAIYSRRTKPETQDFNVSDTGYNKEKLSEHDRSVRGERAGVNT